MPARCLHFAPRRDQYVELATVSGATSTPKESIEASPNLVLLNRCPPSRSGNRPLCVFSLPLTTAARGAPGGTRRPPTSRGLRPGRWSLAGPLGASELPCARLQTSVGTPSPRRSNGVTITGTDRAQRAENRDNRCAGHHHRGLADPVTLGCVSALSWATPGPRRCSLAPRGCVFLGATEKEEMLLPGGLCVSTRAGEAEGRAASTGQDRGEGRRACGGEARGWQAVGVGPGGSRVASRRGSLPPRSPPGRLPVAPPVPTRPRNPQQPREGSPWGQRPGARRGRAVSSHAGRRCQAVADLRSRMRYHPSTG